MYTIPLNHAGTVAESVDVDFDKWPEAAKRYIITYGLTQSVNDAGASAKGTPWEDRRPKMMARLDALSKGDVPSGGGARIPLETKCEIARVVAFLSSRTTATKKALAEVTGAADDRLAVFRSMFAEYIAAAYAAKHGAAPDDKKLVAAVNANWQRHITDPAAKDAEAERAKAAAVAEIDIDV